MKFRNSEINSLVKTVTIYGNLVINDISPVKEEKSREDGKVSRKYYVAYPQSADNSDAARGVTMWQSHNSDGTAAVWKTAPNPARVRRIVDAGEDFQLSGVVAKVELNEAYEVNGNKTTKATVYAAHESLLEQALTETLVNAGLIEAEPATTS